MIAFDNAADLGIQNTAAFSASYTVNSNTNGILWVAIRKLVDDLTSVTYGGVAMTLAGKLTPGSGGSETNYLYYLLAPATGSNTVAVNGSTSGNIAVAAASYTGAAQTGVPDAFGSVRNSSVSSGVLNGPALTTVANNCWAVIFSRKTATGAISAGSGLTRRIHNETTLTYALCDTNGALTPAGAKTLQVNASDGTQDWGHVIASFAPYVATTSYNIMNTVGM